MKSRKRFRVVSNDTGPGIGWPYRFALQAGYWAAYFEYIEFRAGIKSAGWKVQEFVPKHSKKWNKLVKGDK